VSGLRVALTHVTSWPEVRRGGERHLHEFASALADAGHRVSVWSTSPTSASQDHVLGVPIRYLPRRTRPAWFGEQSAEVNFGLEAGLRLATTKLDIWHAFGTADAAAAALLDRVRASVASAYSELGIPDLEYRRSRPDHRLHRRVVDHVGSYICYSKGAGDRLQEGFGRVADIVPGGVDTRRFEPAKERHPEPALLFSGDASEPRKNLALLVDAFVELARRTPCRLWIAGPGDVEPALARVPSALRDSVVHHGTVSDDELVGLYQRAWVTVLPSHLEAFGLVLVESLACGTPIVTLDEWGPSEIVTPVVGATAEATPVSLAAACEQAIELARRPDIVDACRAEARNYDWRSSIVPQVEAIYARISRS
jgi:phosphatidylinositol alpha-mannosyltransferase